MIIIFNSFVEVRAPPKYPSLEIIGASNSLPFERNTNRYLREMPCEGSQYPRY